MSRNTIINDEATEKQLQEESSPVAERKIVPKEIDPNQIIIVRNGFQGRLVYVSPRTKETYKWDEFGSEQEIELRELRNAKSSSKGFFVNNWFMFDDEYAWVIDYLGLNQYYKNSIKIDEFDSLFTKTPAQVEKIVAKLSKGQKKSVEYRARQLILSKSIDSLGVIEALEKSLNAELTVK